MPSIPPILLILIPAILMAVSVVREKELGSIINFYVTPTTRLEFLLGKQLPYIAIGMINYVILMLMAIVVFQVPLKGSGLTLTLCALLYVTATTGIGLLVSTFTPSQVAAVFAQLDAGTKTVHAAYKVPIAATGSGPISARRRTTSGRSATTASASLHPGRPAGPGGHASASSTPPRRPGR